MLTFLGEAEVSAPLKKALSPSGWHGLSNEACATE